MREGKFTGLYMRWAMMRTDEGGGSVKDLLQDLGVYVSYTGGSRNYG